MSAVVVIARLRPRAEAESSVEAVLHDLVTSVHQEPGCTRYAPHRDGATGEVVFVERYVDAAAYEVHRNGAALAQHGARLAATFEDDVRVTVLHPLLDGSGPKGEL